MRREFILLLLGIICISTISSLLSGYVHVESDKILLDTVGGIVGAGNFSYWQLGHSGPLVVELTSLAGDADLYVSDGTRPSFEIDKNNFSSVTCGPDVISIPTEFPRPLGIGVFGHWSHAVSEYSIQVFMDTSAVSEIQYMEQYSHSGEFGGRHLLSLQHDIWCIDTAVNFCGATYLSVNRNVASERKSSLQENRR